jgi:hypothetical protein
VPGQGVPLHPTIAASVNTRQAPSAGKPKKAQHQGSASGSAPSAKRSNNVQQQPVSVRTSKKAQQKGGASAPAPNAGKSKKAQQKPSPKVPTLTADEKLDRNFDRFMSLAKPLLIRTNSGEMQATNTFDDLKACSSSDRKNAMAYSQFKVKGAVAKLSSEFIDTATNSFNLEVGGKDLLEKGIHKELTSLSGEQTQTHRNLSKVNGAKPVGRINQWIAAYEPSGLAIQLSGKNNTKFTIKDKSAYIGLIKDSFLEQRGQELHQKIENNLNTFITAGGEYDGTYHIHGMHAEIAAVNDTLFHIDTARSNILSLVNGKTDDELKQFKQEIDNVFDKIVKSDDQEENLIRLITLKGDKNKAGTAQGGDFCACVQCKLTLSLNNPGGGELILDIPTEFGSDKMRKTL